MRGHLRKPGFPPVVVSAVMLAVAAVLVPATALPAAASAIGSVQAPQEASLGSPPNQAVWGLSTLAPEFAAVTVSPTALLGKNAWYWPTGHDIASSGSSWLQYRTWYSDAPAWHVAYDDCDPYRTPVLALTWGKVLIARSDVSGYGRGGAPGGAVVVLYKSAAGQEFKALYGHVQEIRVTEGASVRPGQTLAVLNNYDPPHCHFGINMGSEYPSNPASKYYVGMLMGHTHDYTVVAGRKTPVTYNWVDPIAFLNNNRPFEPPPASLTTPTVPASVRPFRAFSASGILSPRHRRGTRPVYLELQRSIEDTWTTPTVVRGTVWDCRSGSKWKAVLRQSVSGRWRVRAHVTPDASHLEAYSGWAEFTVRAPAR